jgi:hypothetical protein
MPIKPRGERGNRWLRYLLGAVLLALAVGGTAFAITWFLDDDDSDGGQVVAQATATATAESDSGATQTPETLAEPTATSAAPPEPSPTAQQEETPAPTEEAAVPAPTEESAGSAGESSGDVTAEDFLPAAADLDGTWEVQAEGFRTQAEVGEALGEGGEDALVQFGWQENAYRDFGREAGDAETFFISVSVHRFDSADGAREGLTYFSDVLAASGLYQDAAAVEIGDASVAMEGSQNGANLYALYVLDGNFMIRFGGSSLTGDPAPFVNDVAEAVVSGS